MSALHDPQRIARRREAVQKAIASLPQPLTGWGFIVHDNDGQELQLLHGPKHRMLGVLARFLTAQSDPSLISYLLGTYREIQEQHDSLTPVFVVRVDGPATEFALETAGSMLGFAIDKALRPADLPS